MICSILKSAFQILANSMYFNNSSTMSLWHYAALTICICCTFISIVQFVLLFCLIQYDNHGFSNNENCNQVKDILYFIKANSLDVQHKPIPLLQTMLCITIKHNSGQSKSAQKSSTMLNYHSSCAYNLMFYFDRCFLG